MPPVYLAPLPLTWKQKPQEGHGFLSLLCPALTPGSETVHTGTQEILNPYLLNYTNGIKEKKAHYHHLLGAEVRIKAEDSISSNLTFYKDLG